MTHLVGDLSAELALPVARVHDALVMARHHPSDIFARLIAVHRGGDSTGAKTQVARHAFGELKVDAFAAVDARMVQAAEALVRDAKCVIRLG